MALNKIRNTTLFDPLLNRKSGLHIAVAWFAMVAVGVLLLVLAYCLPNDIIRQHVQQSLPNIEARWGWEYFPDMPNAQMDLRTDCRMLASAVYDGKEPLLERVMGAYSLKSEKLGMEQVDLLRATLGEADDAVLDEYPRYWHGYLVPLRLLLLFGDYFSVLYCAGAILLLLIVLLAYLLVKKHETAMLPPLVVTLLLASPVSLVMSTQYHAVTFIMLLSLLAGVCLKDRLKGHWGLVFFVLGGIVNYFDFFTFPLLALGPLLVLFLSTMGDDIPWQKQVLNVALAALLWFLGYGLMWVSKWILASVVLHKNVIEDASKQVAVRSSNVVAHGYGQLANGKHFSHLRTILVNGWRIAGSWFNALVIIAYPVVFGIWAQKRRSKGEEGTRLARFPRCKLPALIAIALLPLIWAFAVSNHTYTHSTFTYRIFLVSIFCVLYIPSYIMSHTSVGHECP
ncbi:MAG: hypothetical protein IKF78_07010 [Atopobiaceae bacterium]|nr:hypothetical protein [Atopobiaceae bacterium]